MYNTFLFKIKKGSKDLQITLKQDLMYSSSENSTFLGCDRFSSVELYV